jgi:tetratricopeptide (TPR) repeat protein
MLETIREFAAEMLAIRGETDPIAARHALEVLALAQRASRELSGADQRQWLDRLEREHDNARAALDWSTAHDPTIAARLAFAMWRFWQQRGYLNEARARFDAMSSLRPLLEPVDRARFAEAYGGIAYWQSDEVTAKEQYDDALEIWRGIGDKREIANALYNRSYAEVIVLMGGGQLDEADTGHAMLEEALEIYREIGDTGGEGNILWGLGTYYFFGAEAASAESWYLRSLELHRQAGDRTMEAWSLHMLSLANAGQSQFERAQDYARHALRHFFEAGDIAGVTLTLDDLAIVAINQADRTRGGRLWGAARHLQESTGTILANYVEQSTLLYDVPTPKDVLSADELATLSAEGAAMRLDDLVAYALDVSERELATTHEEGSA